MDQKGTLIFGMKIGDYRKFVEGVSKSETKNPLKDVFASTFLWSPEFITWAKENSIDAKNADTRNIPVMRDLIDNPSLEQTERTTESIIGRKHPFFKKICIYVSHQYGGFALKEIGTYYGMRGSAISQSSRRFKQRILEDKKLKKTMAEIARKVQKLRPDPSRPLQKPIRVQHSWPPSRAIIRIAGVVVYFLTFYYICDSQKKRAFPPFF
jgi:hypothetical protein